MSSKRKKRQAEWEKREAKRAEKKFSWDRFQKAKDANNIEEMAGLLGVRLK